MALDARSVGFSGTCAARQSHFVSDVHFARLAAAKIDVSRKKALGGLGSGPTAATMFMVPVVLTQ
jgi:hypothetical protein